MAPALTPTPTPSTTPTLACSGKYPYDLEDDVEVSESQRSAMMLERMEGEKYPLPPHVVSSVVASAHRGRGRA